MQYIPTILTILITFKYDIYSGFIPGRPGFPDFFIPEFPGMIMQRFPDQNGNGLWLNSL